MIGCAQRGPPSPLPTNSPPRIILSTNTSCVLMHWIVRVVPNLWAWQLPWWLCVTPSHLVCLPWLILGPRGRQPWRNGRNGAIPWSFWAALCFLLIFLGEVTQRRVVLRGWRHLRMLLRMLIRDRVIVGWDLVYQRGVLVLLCCFWLRLRFMRSCLTWLCRTRIVTGIFWWLSCVCFIASRWSVGVVLWWVRLRGRIVVVDFVGLGDVL